SNKPIMEKRRRARINHCLNELKSLILDAMKKDPARHSKLEKADILEMTVKHLQNVQRQQLSQAVSTDPHTLHKFKAGFSECATEVSRYVSRMDGVEPAVRQRLVAHLSGCVQGLQQIAPSPFSFPPLGQGLGAAAAGLGLGQGLGAGLASSLSAATPSVLQQVQQQVQQAQQQLSGDINNNSNVSSTSRVQGVQSVQLIPSRLPTGELALLLPNSGQLSSQLTSAGLVFPAASAAAAAPVAAATTPAAAPAVPVESTNVIGLSTPVMKTSPHPSAFTAVGSLSLSGLGSVAATPPASETASASASASGSASNSPDTPPSSARALQLSRVAADSSTPSTPESMSASPCSQQGRPSTDSHTTPTSSSVEIKVEPKLEPVEVLTPRAPHPGPRASSALDFSFKRCMSDSSEAEAEAEGAPPSKIPRYTLSVLSAPATSTASSTSVSIGAPFAPAPLSHGLARPLPLPASMHGGNPVDEKDRDMWRPW
ncbi:Protein deadpan, partial [Frankliniella fusca]